jgi:hypothetical protein
MIDEDRIVNASEVNAKTVGCARILLRIANAQVHVHVKGSHYAIGIDVRK